MMQNMSRTVINLLWLVGLLCFLLVCSLSVRWSGLPNLSEIIAFALSLSSLILAVIAIVQNLVSGDGLSRALHDISRASENILSTSTTLQNASAALDSKAETITTLPNKISDLIEKNSSSRLETKISSATLPADTVSNNVFAANPFNDSLPNGGVIALYAALRSWQASKPYRHNAIFGNTFSNFKEGILLGLDAVGLIKVNNDKGEFTIESMGHLTEELILKLVEESSNNNNKSSKYVREEISKIRNFFAKSNTEEESADDQSDEP